MGATRLPAATPRNRRVSVNPHPFARFISLAAGAVWLGIGETSMWHLAETGQIQTVLIGRRRLIPRAEIERYEAQLLATSSGFPKPAR